MFDAGDSLINQLNANRTLFQRLLKSGLQLAIGEGLTVSARFYDAR
jgi:hypothetical protein